MGDMSKEPSMEEILSSIKRIIAEEGEEAVHSAAPLARRARTEPVEVAVPGAAPAAASTDAEEVLELTDLVEEEVVAKAPSQTRAAPAPVKEEAPSILSVESEVATRQSLSALSAMLVKPRDGEDNTLDGLVRSMLRPMLKEWLDANLPAMVQDMVAREIARITGAQ